MDLTMSDVACVGEDKLMAHILDCVAALVGKQRVRVALKQPLTLTPNGEALTAEQQVAHNKVFQAALASLACGLMHDGAIADAEQSAAVRELSRAFPSAAKQTDGRGWLPLHWAVVAATGHYGVTEADVKAVYEVNPLVLCRHHMVNHNGSDFVGLTPSHLLCTLEMTEQTKALVRFFSVVYDER